MIKDSPSTAQATDDSQALSPIVILLVCVVSAIVAGFAMTTQSYWIDEALSVIVASAKTPTQAWHTAHVVGGSVIQMPFYEVYLYGWHKFFGSGEWIMRASNIPWFVLGQLAFLLLFRHQAKFALTACLLAAVSPFLWLYLDETRPYIMLYAASCWLLAILIRFLYPHKESPPLYPFWWLATLAVSVLVLCSSSLIGVIWGGGFIGAILLALLLAPQRIRVTGGTRVQLLLGGVLFVLSSLIVAFYYWRTWGVAAHGYHTSPFSWLVIPFWAYEILGFSGFGPGELQMRVSPFHPLLQSLPLLIPLAAILSLLGWFALRQFIQKRPDYRVLGVWFVALALPILTIAVAFLWLGNRPLPRHFIPLMPAVILGLSSLLILAVTQKSIVWRATAVLLPILWLASSLNLRLAPRHAKEDYRRASQIAAAALKQKKEVWWLADAAAAYVYSTPVTLTNTPGFVWALQAPSWEFIRYKFPPNVIIMSKPDIYDPHGAAVRYIKENQFSPIIELHAFTVFSRHNEPLETP